MTTGDNGAFLVDEGVVDLVHQTVQDLFATGNARWGAPSRADVKITLQALRIVNTAIRKLEEQRGRG